MVQFTEKGYMIMKNPTCYSILVKHV